MKPAHTIVALVLTLASSSSCRLFGQGIPCDHDDNCPGNAHCGLDGFCGTPGAPNGGGTVATLKGRASCSSSDDCGGDACSSDGTCAVTTFLDAGAPLADVRTGGSSIAFILVNAFSQSGVAIGVASRAQASGGTFTKHDGESGAFNLVSGNVFAWLEDHLQAQGTIVVRKLDGASAADAGTVNVQNFDELGVSVAVSGDRVLWTDHDVVRANDTSTTLALPELVSPAFGTVTASVIGADDREIWGVGKSLVVADADPSRWSEARSFTAPPAQSLEQIVLGETRAFFREGGVNNQQTIASIARDDPSSPGLVVDTIDGDNTGLFDIAAAGDNVLAVTNTEIRLYPADGSERVSLATVSAPFDVAFADGFAWWSDGNSIKRVRIAR